VTDKQLDAAASPSALIELDLNLLIWFYYNTFLKKKKLIKRFETFPTAEHRPCQQCCSWTQWLVAERKW